MIATPPPQPFPTRQGYRIWALERTFQSSCGPWVPDLRSLTLARPGHESPRVPGECSERTCERNETRDPAQKVRSTLPDQTSTVGSHAIALFLQERGTRLTKERPRRSGAPFRNHRGAGSGGGTTTAGPPTVPPLSQTLAVSMAPSASVRDG